MHLSLVVRTPVALKLIATFASTALYRAPKDALVCS